MTGGRSGDIGMRYKEFDIRTAERDGRWQAQIRRSDRLEVTCQGVKRKVFVTPDAPTEDYAIEVARAVIDQKYVQ